MRTDPQTTTTMSKTQRWEWAIGLKFEELSDKHLQLAYKLNWDNLCKFDSCRKNCKRTLCLACFDKSWIDNDSANNSGYDHYDTTNADQKRADLKTFVGLKNLGATCYVNCLLQLWFHNPALRKAIYQWDKESNESVIKEVTPKNDFNNSQPAKVTTPKRPREDPEKSTPRKMLKTKEESNLTPAIVQITTPPCTKSERQKPKDSVQTNPIEQLQLIFARLQFTNKKSIDPFSFIDSLALNAAEQQDAQEFGNLFMEFLEKSFANQKDNFVSKIIQSQFCGKYSYATICDACKQCSLSDSNFYELDLSIQNLETLHDCLRDYFRPVPLDGKYNCPRCQKAQSAHRKIILKSLPPTLNLQLLRFVYDVQRNVRQKLNSHIIFPEVLDMTQFLGSGEIESLASSDQSGIYILSAVLIHRGSSPHSGHYIAHIKDRISKDWYKFNDDSVERIGPQLQVSTDGENITIVDGKTETFKIADPRTGRVTRIESKNLKSKTAYMLVYQAEDNEALFYPSDHCEEWELPEHLQTAVLEENSRSDELFESLQIAREVDEQIIISRKNQIRTIYEKLVCRDPMDKFEFIDKQWLQRWLTNSSSSAKFDPIDNSHLLCIHDKLDFRKIDQVKCIRTEGADLLYNEFGGGPRLQDAMCQRCVELEVRLIQLKERLKEEQKYITSQAKFKLDQYDFADAYIVGKKSYRVWQALVMVQFEKSHPDLARRKEDNNSSNNHPNSSDEEEKDKVEKCPASNSDSEDDDAIEKFSFNSDVLCDHNQLIHDTSAWRIVPKEVWTIFKSYFGNDPTKPLIELNANTLMCADCKRQEDEQQEIGDALKQKASEQKSKLPDLFHNRKRASWCTMLPGDEYYAVDKSFLTKWRQFLRNPCNLEVPKEVSNKERLLCEHGKMLYDHSNSNPIQSECNFVLVTREELDGLRCFYPIDKDIRFYIDMEKADRKQKLHMATLKTSPCKKSTQLDGSGDTDAKPVQVQANGTSDVEKKVDLDEIDWSDCVVSDPGFCSECHEMLKQDELKKLLNYSTTTIYITRVENVNGTNNLIVNENCDNELGASEENDVVRRKKSDLGDEANDFVPPGSVKPGQGGSILRRTTRRKSKKDQAYEIKPSQTLLELKKQIFSRCQVLPVDQKLYLDGTLLDDNTKTMSELAIVPFCSLELEVDRPVSDSVDLIEDEPPSRKSCKYRPIKNRINRMMLDVCFDPTIGMLTNSLPPFCHIIIMALYCNRMQIRALSLVELCYRMSIL